MTDTDRVYKILSPADWAAAVAHPDGITDTVLDRTDGFVHLSTRGQVGETLALHYKGAADVRLLEYALDQLGEVRWEPSRGGALFPHLYAPLAIAKARRSWTLALDPAGIPALPEDL